MGLVKRIFLVLGIVALIVLSIVGVALARDSYVLSALSGASQSGGTLITYKDYNWTFAPENPNVVYVAVWAPDPYRDYIEKALVEVIGKHSLTPVIVDDVQNYDLKGRFVLFYGPVVEENDGLIYNEISISGILYYSYAGDVESAVETINRGLAFSEAEIDKSAETLREACIERLLELRIANQTCDVAYWWHLKGKVGKLAEGDPYEMVASEIASQLDQFLRIDSDEP